MAQDQSWGPGLDRDLWTHILADAGDNIAHRLWCAVVRETAIAYLERSYDTIPADQFDEIVETLIRDWQDEALPYGNHLAWVLGELDYFRNVDLAWEERVAFAGEPCGYPIEVLEHLKETLVGYPDAQDAVTEMAIQDFFEEWRTRFFRRVLREVEALG